MQFVKAFTPLLLHMLDTMTQFACKPYFLSSYLANHVLIIMMCFIADLVQRVLSAAGSSQLIIVLAS